jgi:retron-type reverse transcriptase
MHLVDAEFLREAYHRTSKSGAPGVDGVTARQYVVELDANLEDLHERMSSGRYQAPPVERVWIAKEDGRQRPIGKPTFEDKVAQRAVTMLLEAVYEGDFRDFLWVSAPPQRASGTAPAQGAVREDEGRLDSGRGCQWILRQP